MATINGFQVLSAYGSPLIGSFIVPGTDVAVAVRRDVAPLLIGFLQEFDQKVERLRRGQCWGFAPRLVRGGATPSFHSAGIAVDINAPIHVMGKRGTFSKAQATTIRQLCRKYGLRWGGDYSKRADEMHVEVIVSRAEALLLVKKLQIVPAARVGVKMGSKTPFPISGGVFGIAGKDYSGTESAAAKAGVRWIEKRLNVLTGTKFGDNGFYDKSTAAHIKSFQKAHKLDQDGRVGPATWAALDKAA